MHRNSKKPTGNDCNTCSLNSDRRAFIRNVSLATIGIMTSLGLSEKSAIAMAVNPIQTVKRSGKTRTYPIPAEDGVKIDKENEVILVRWLDTIYAFALSCPHQRNSLAWLKDDSKFQCPKHRSQYSPDGYFISGRATRGMDRYAIKRDGDNVVVDLEVLYQETKNKTAWEAACVEL